MYIFLVSLRDLLEPPGGLRLVLWVLIRMPFSRQNFVRLDVKNYKNV